MERYEGQLKAVRGAAPGEIFGTSLLDPSDELGRQQAIACYLSSSDGWQEAIKMVGGAFAPEERQRRPGLTSGKAD